jgi:hypothetical protein
MAHDAAFAAREHRCHLAGERRRHGMAHEVDAAVHRMQALVGDAVIDSVRAQPGGEQLAARYGPALPGGNASNGWVARHDYRQTAGAAGRRRADRGFPA